GFGTGSRFDPGGDGGVVRGRPPVWVRQLGLRARRILPELSVGLSAGLLGWLAVLSAALLLGLLVAAMGGEEALTREPSEQIVWLATLPVGLRLAVSLVAGVVEELFFRGFLQPRVGIAASSLLFAGAHVAYGEPFLLFGVLLLSLFYAWLTRWRGSVYAAMAAHFLFDAIQLLVVIPAVLRIIATGSAFGT
ncbi:MAG: CPBP family intramembrane metalloprotease, partial [bacterium]|nr:CPBP family intramembrane metalloprotease [bacterium]